MKITSAVPGAGSGAVRGLLPSIALSAFAGPAVAHPAVGGFVGVGGFVSGFAHPLAGWDHLIAMVAVGIWASLLGVKAVRRLPLLFLLVMACAGVLGAAGLRLPAVEPAIAVSAIVLGVLVAASLRPSLLVACAVVGGFAVAHGHAHGIELPQAAGLLEYSLGFLLGTGLLHLCGIGIGRLLRRPVGALAVRAAGGAIALAGVALLAGVA